MKGKSKPGGKQQQNEAGLVAQGPGLDRGQEMSEREKQASQPMVVRDGERGDGVQTREFGVGSLKHWWEICLSISHALRLCLEEEGW